MNESQREGKDDDEQENEDDTTGTKENISEVKVVQRD